MVPSFEVTPGGFVTKVLSNPKRVRAMIDGFTVVDSRRSVFVWEKPWYPALYFPAADVAAGLRPTGSTRTAGDVGEVELQDLVIPGGSTVTETAWVVPGTAAEDGEAPDPAGMVGIDWDAMDAWFEEDVQVFVHPRSPEVRVDALASSRHVKVSVGGTVVAESVHPVVLYETGLPPRHYLPKVDVRMDLLSPTQKVSACPYKGFASYWSVMVDGVTHEDVVWGYDSPFREALPIAGMVCFYDEKVDLELDGVAQQRPVTKFA